MKNEVNHGGDRREVAPSENKTGGLGAAMERINPNAGKNYRKVYGDRVTAGKQPKFLPPPTRGSGVRMGFGFSPSQAQRISRGIAWLEATFASGPKEVVNGREYFPNIRFLTLTFGREIEHDEAKKRWSTLLKRVKRKYKGVEYVWVAEIQPARLMRDGEAVIHFHAVLSTELDAAWLWGAWAEINGGERFRVDIQRLHKSPAAYMAKYMAKSGRKSEGRHVAESIAKTDRVAPKELLAQLKINEGKWWEMDEAQRRTLTKRMTIQGNRTGMSHGVSKALKPVKVDEVHWREAVPKERVTQLKFADWDEENFSFLGVWGFDKREE